MESGAKVVGYVRISKAEEGKDALSLDAQAEKIRRECEYRGWDLVEVVSDAGRTGTNTDRPGFRRALEMVGNGDVVGLVSAKLDRVSRSVIDFGTILAWFEAARASLVILDPDIDTSSASGMLVANVLAAVASWEVAAISERTTVALAAKRARGETICRPSVCDQPDVLERIKALRAEGLSLRAIADALNDEGVPTLRGAARWTYPTIQTALGYKRPKRRKSSALPTVPRRAVAA